MKKLLLSAAMLLASMGSQAQTATFKYFKYDGNDARFDKI